MIQNLVNFVSRNPWIFVPLAFVLLIGGWITIYVLASGVDTSQIPVDKPVPSQQSSP